MAATDSISRYRLKKTLDTLASKSGRGTELISLYIPPDRKIHEVMANLREEYGTASNIKSRTTRKNVQDAIERVTQRLKLFKEPPPRGLAIFCGAIPQNGPGTEKMETYILEPPQPIGVYFYRCDDTFHLEPLREIMREKDTYGMIVLDGTEAVLATLRGRNMDILKQFTSGVPGKHRAGGQSARRFERIREAEINDYFKRVGAHSNEIFLQIPDLRGLILGGPGPTKYDFRDGEYLNYLLKQKIVATVDTAYVGENGVKEVVERSSEIFRGVRYAEERKLMQRFLYEVGHDTGLAVYGEKEVRRCMNTGLIDTLILSEKMGAIHVTVKCKNCGSTDDLLISSHEIVKFEQDLLNRRCTACSSQTLFAEKTQEVLDELVELAEGSSVNVEIIASQTEEGTMLLESFGGIAAILRYKAS